ncbi:putative transcription factor [Phaeomoniella chlamydospora]|uniref:Putative transcription factor n=1 Tax=Phaeomoniella chlamydospora TaxID=158046 RepID=A0A0G2GYE3_PHACM|nr:putative transcription factor [Phaeomoniella chlamydospora]
MAIRGQKFELDLSDDEGNFTFKPVQEHAPPAAQVSTSTRGLMIGEIQERDPAAPPAPPNLQSTPTGFPAHRKRFQTSKFKQARASSGSHPDPATLAQNAISRGPSDQAIAHHLRQKHGITPEDIEKKQIHEENKTRLASMSVEEIEDARNEIMAQLNPTMLEKLLQRANIEDPSISNESINIPESQGISEPPQTKKTSGETGDDKRFPERTTKKSVSFDAPDPPTPPLPSSTLDTNNTQSSTTAHTIAPDDAEPTSTSSMHFPVPPRDPSTMPDLDPTSPSFLSDLQTHYFPNTPHDSKSLSWLSDPSPNEISSSPYNPHSTSSGIPISSLRFSFTGALLPPSRSSTIDPREGLHHHGLDPSSAGYTIPEISMLTRSTVPGQRCMSFMMLGRVLYRLGSGGFGAQGTDLVEGLWECIEHERGLEVMIREANQEGIGARNRSVKAYATEGVWLWRRGMEVGGMGNERGWLKEGEIRGR